MSSDFSICVFKGAFEQNLIKNAGLATFLFLYVLLKVDKIARLNPCGIFLQILIEI